MGLYALVMGFLYLLSGTGEIIGFIGFDVFGGIMLIIISSVYIYGAILLFRRKKYSFFLAGLILSLVYAILYALIAVAHYLEFLIGNIENFNLIKEMRVEIWLFLLALPALYYTLGKFGGGYNASSQKL